MLILLFFYSLSSDTSLVRALTQLGPDTTNNSEAVRTLLERFGMTEQNPPYEAQVIEIISNLGRLSADGTSLRDIGALVRALASFVSRFYHLSIKIVLTNFVQTEREAQLVGRHQVFRPAGSIRRGRNSLKTPDIHPQ